MKKLLSLMLSLIMALGVSTVTFAAPTYTDVPQISINKVYNLLNGGTNPAETVTFKINYVSSSHTTYSENDIPRFNQNGYSFNITEGAATTGTTINLPTYDRVGVFNYEITEVSGNTAGVTYQSNAINMKVTVVQDEDGLKRQVALYNSGETNPTKTGTITNIYKAGNLQITKEVKGNMGQKERYFPIDVTLNAPANKEVKSTISVGATSYTDANGNGNPTEIEIGEKATFYLKDGESINLGNVPYGVEYTVVEEAVGDGYLPPKYKVNNVEVTTAEDSINSSSETVVITNTKEDTVVTGVIVDNLPYIIILAGVVVGMGVFFIKKRTANNN